MPTALHGDKNGMAIEKREQTEQSAPSSRDKPRSGYARLRLRHRNLIEVYEQLHADHDALRQAHEELEAAFSELLALHDGLLADLKEKKRHPLTAALLGDAHV